MLLRTNQDLPGPYFPAHHKNTTLRKKLENYSYLLEDTIGSGYSSKVFRGRNDLTGQNFAIKMIDLKMLTNPIHEALLYSQIACLKKLNCYSNIIRLVDVFTTKNNTYIITQLCENGDLCKHLSSLDSNPQHNYYSPASKQQIVIGFMEQIINGYLNIWRNGIIHRDLKPANIFLDKNNNLKIADFGFAIAAENVQQNRSYNVGSPLYMPPEALVGSRYSYKSDIWALGIMFYEMLTGRHPWKAPTEKQLATVIKSRSILKIIPSSLSPESIEFLVKTLNPDINERMSPSELEQFSFRSKTHPQKYEEFKSGLNLGRTNNTQARNSLKSIEDPFLQTEANFSKNNLNATLGSFHILTSNHLESAYFQKSPLDNQRYLSNKIIKTDYAPQENTSFPFLKENQSKPNLKKNRSSFPTEDLTAYHPEHQYSVNNPENMYPFPQAELSSEERKTTTSILLSEIHFCRFLYKLVLRLPDIKIHPAVKLREQLLAVIFEKFELLLSTKINNPYFIDNIEAYRKTPDFVKIMSVVMQYQNKYEAVLPQHSLPTSDVGVLQSLIRDVIIRLYDLIRDYLPYDMDRVQEQVILLDYLLTCSQLVTLNSENSLQTFWKKSNMEVIAAGVANSEVTLSHFIAIEDKMRALGFL